MNLLDKIGRDEPAAIMSGWITSVSVNQAVYPDLQQNTAQLRERIGDQAFESLLRQGAAMDAAAMVEFAQDQIAQTRSQLVNGSS